MQKETILIVDDSEMNRSILADMLSEEYEILEAVDGREAVASLRHRVDISLVLLDFVMPNMDGFGVLDIMNRNGWINNIPVIMISAENSPAHIERAYELGVTDFITRPFDMFIVRRRVVNTLMLYGRQKELSHMVDEQIYEKERNSRLMINILSHIMEVRNGESGQHVHNVRRLTDFLLRSLLTRTDRYPLSESDITLIVTASSLHDIGKNAIDERILNKPGKLTDEEYAIMKTHTVVGAQILESIELEDGNALVKVARDICRWHHERYDGKGYPDGLSGEEIPISAQIVALADVYDALTSKRAYKEPLDGRTAIEMIVAGKCGAFNPLLLECLSANIDALPAFMETPVAAAGKQQEARTYMEVVSRNRGSGMYDQILHLLDYERIKNAFFASLAKEIQFEYTPAPPILTFSEWGARKLGIEESLTDPENNEKLREILGDDGWRHLSDALRTSTPETPDVTLELPITLEGRKQPHRIIARSVWSNDPSPQYEGALGIAVELPDTQAEL